MARRVRGGKVKRLAAVIACLALLLCAGCTGKADETKALACTLSFLDTGKSDCIIIQMDGLIIVNDAALEESYTGIINKLSALGIEKIDYLILSHFDNDHIGAAPQLLHSIPVGTVLMPDYDGGSPLYRRLTGAIEDTKTPYSVLTEDYIISTANGSITVKPPVEKYYEDVNNFSLITDIIYGEKRILLCGDAMKIRLDQQIQALGADAHYNLIKLPHHGDFNKGVESLIAKTEPDCAVITVAEKSFAKKKLLSALENVGCETFFTCKGEITVVCDGKSLDVMQGSL